MVNGVVIGLSVLHVIFIIWATIVGSRNGRPVLGFVLGLLLSWVGLIIYLIGPKTPTPDRRGARRHVRASFLRFLNFALA
jgi:hypothetical protein